VRDAINKEIYKGVDFHDYPDASDGGSLEDFIAKHGIGTDLALNFARSAFCARLPITERMLDEVIAFLNDKNREYAEGEADYNWSVWADNCVHTLRNALAAANIWSPLSVRAVKFLQIFNLAVPANEFVNLAELGNEGNIADYEQIQQNDPQRDALYEFNWLPTRHGALLKTLPVYEPNDLYDTTFRMFTLQSPLRMGKTEHAIKLLSDDRFVKLDANLRYFRDRYDAILAKHDELRDRLASVRGTPYRRIARLHYEYIKTQRVEVSTAIRAGRSARLVNDARVAPRHDEVGKTPDPTNAISMRIADQRRGSRNRPPSLKIPQDSKAGAGRREMLERMPTQDMADRIDCMIVEFEQFGECIKRRGDKPVRHAGISCRKRNE